MESGGGEPAKAGGASELPLRVVSALVLIAIVLLATWAGGLAFAAFCALVTVLVLHEYLAIVRRVLPAGIIPAAFGGLAAVLGGWFFAGPAYALSALAAAVSVLLLLELVATRRFWGAAGLAYASLPFVALVLLRGGDPTGFHAILLLFASVWGTDTLAYFAGRAIGGPKLAPAISPKKTWSGFFGGIAGAMLASALILVLCGYRPSAGALVLVVLLSIVSQLGDLGESWLKRRFGVKDSGTIIPGHGGLLDRIDGLVLAAVAAWLAGGALSGDPLLPAGAAQGLFAAFVLP